MNNRNNLAIPLLLLLLAPLIILSYFIVKWANSNCLIDQIDTEVSELINRFLEIAIQILQKAFV